MDAKKASESRMECLKTIIIIQVAKILRNTAGHTKFSSGIEQLRLCLRSGYTYNDEQDTKDFPHNDNNYNCKCNFLLFSSH